MRQCDFCTPAPAGAHGRTTGPHHNDDEPGPVSLGVLLRQSFVSNAANHAEKLLLAMYWYAAETEPPCTGRRSREILLKCILFSTTSTQTFHKKTPTVSVSRQEKLYEDSSAADSRK